MVEYASPVVLRAIHFGAACARVRSSGACESHRIAPHPAPPRSLLPVRCATAPGLQGRGGKGGGKKRGLEASDFFSSKLAQQSPKTCLHSNAHAHPAPAPAPAPAAHTQALPVTPNTQHQGNVKHNLARDKTNNDILSGKREGKKKSWEKNIQHD